MVGVMAAGGTGGTGGAARRAPGEFSRIKPEIYRTDDGRVIVEDELLNFIVVKMRTLSHDDIVSVVTSSYSSDRIESSKAVLSELLPHNKRWVTHRGQKKDINNVKLCLQVLNECGEEIPRFVSHFLDELPPVSFKHIDVSALLGKMQQINADIDLLKRTMVDQVAACETLREVSATLNSRLTAVEGPCGLDPASSVPCLTALDIQPDPAPSETCLSLTMEKQQPGHDSAPCTTAEENGWTRTRSGEVAQMEDLAAGMGRTQPSAWSTVVKEGRRLKQVPENSAYRRATPRSGRTPARHARKKPSIIGTGEGSNILAVKTKMVRVFATKFDPCVDVNTLSDYLKKKLGREVTCRKIETTQSRFNSFCVSAECQDVEELYDPQLWPAGIYIRRYYEPRHARGVGGGPPGTEDAPRTRDVGLLHSNDAGVPPAPGGRDECQLSSGER